MIFFRIFAFAVVCAFFSAYASPQKELDRLLEENHKKQGLSPVAQVPDSIFLRRAMLNINGKLPTVQEIRQFSADKSSNKYAQLVDRLIASPSFADILSWRFADMFRIKSEFPINLWPNAVQSYHRFFRDAVVQNRSWNSISRDLLTSSGSNFRVPGANFFRASAERTPEGLAKVTALAFMGIRTDRMTEEDRKAFAVFFSRIRFKSTDEWKEEIVYLDPAPARLCARTPDGKTFEIVSPQTDPRTVFADWLLAPGNPFFARAFVNRVWHWLFGRGLVEPADDMPLPSGGWDKFVSFFSLSGKDPCNENVLDFLAAEFERSNYDIKKLFALIMNSRAYRADWKTLPAEQENAEKCFAVYPLRRLEAEILVDAYSQILGDHESYSSVIPEPFTFLPKGAPAVTIADGSISSRTLDNFGKPSRDAGTFGERNSAVTPSQRLFLMNSNWIYRRTNSLPRRIFGRRRLNEKQRIEELYLTVLSRKPTENEIKTIRTYRKKLGRKNGGRVWADLAWALINTKEFLYHH